MATLVFDIETTAQPLENFDEAQQEYLFREAERMEDETAKTAKREEITRFMKLSEPCVVPWAGPAIASPARASAAPDRLDPSFTRPIPRYTDPAPNPGSNPAQHPTPATTPVV